MIESEPLCRRIAASLQKTCDQLDIDVIFKASYGNANRSSGQSICGPELDAGFRVQEKICVESGVPVLTDVHTEVQAIVAGVAVDVSYRLPVVRALQAH